MSPKDWNQAAKISMITIGVIGGLVSFGVAKLALDGIVDAGLDIVDTIATTFADDEDDEAEEETAA